MSIIDRPDVQPAVPTLPASAYRDPAMFERERRDIFAREWLLYGRSDQLLSPGDFLSATIIGYPVIVVRQADGSLRGFHNVCRHRAAMLTQDTSGSMPGGMIRCPYHSWTYQLDGCLNRAPGFGAAKGEVEPADLSLFPIAADEWRGLVFVCIATAGPSLIEWLGPIVPLAAHSRWRARNTSCRRTARSPSIGKSTARTTLNAITVRTCIPACVRRWISAATRSIRIRSMGCFISTAPSATVVRRTVSISTVFPFLMLNFYQWGSSIATLEPLGAGRVRHVNWYLFSDISPERAEENGARPNGRRRSSPRIWR